MARRHLLQRGALVAAATVLLLTGCDQQQWRDLENQTQTEPDRVRLVTNVDGYPNVVALCINGAGFATTTRDAQGAIMRVEAWDKSWCGAAQQ